MNKQTVTIRLYSDLHEEFKNICEKQGLTMTDVIVDHMKEQVKGYRKPKTGGLINDNFHYSKLSMRVDKDLYKNYKISMIVSNTTPTADIIRFVKEYVK